MPGAVAEAAVAAVSVELDPPEEKTPVSFLSAFPMFVPSLSW